MIEKVFGRFDFKSTASKISKMVDLVSHRFNNPRSDITKQIDRMAAVLQQLAAIKAIMDEGLQVEMLVASIDFVEMRAVVACLKTLADVEVKWDSVAHLIF